MDYVKPADVVGMMLEEARRRLSLAPVDLLLRGMMSGALIGFAAAFAFNGAISTDQALVGALIFPVGLVIIVLLGLELVTGSFGLLPLAVADGSASPRPVIGNWSWVFLGNILGSVIFGALPAVTLTNAGSSELSALGQRIVAVTEAKTLAYRAAGGAGLLTVFVKAILCNWMACLGVVLAMASTSTIGKIVCAWLPIAVFFSLGFEHAVVNMFIIPTGMMLGADISMSDWWIWNQIPVTLGNLVGGAVCCAPLYLAYRPSSKVVPLMDAGKVPAE